MNKKLLIVILVLAAIGGLTIQNMKESKSTAGNSTFTDLSSPLNSSFGTNGENDVTTTPDNSSDELRAVLAEMKIMKTKLSEFETESSEFKNIRSTADIESEVSEIQRKLNLKNSEIEKLNLKIENLKKDVKENKTTSTSYNSDHSVNEQLGINKSTPKVVSVDDDSIPILSRPNSNKGKPTNKTNTGSNQNITAKKGADFIPLGNSVESSSSSNAIVWYGADDEIVTVDKQGNQTVEYPFSSLDISGVNLVKSEELPLDKEKENTKKGNQKEITAHEIYTIPTNSTLWDAISMGSMIGRVPSGGTLKNPYRFKVLLSNDNMASNGIYIPNLKDMVLSGYLEGDMLLECLRGTIDSVTYTFNDGRIATTQGEGGAEGGQIAHISDQWGNECIPGTYVSTLDTYVTYVGGASAISSVGELLSDAGTTTTTDGTAITETLSSSTSASSVVGSALEGAATATSDFIEDQLDDAFSAVLIEAGEPLVIHVDSQIVIDYDTMGRKIVNQENVEEFLN